MLSNLMLFYLFISSYLLKIKCSWRYTEFIYSRFSFLVDNNEFFHNFTFNRAKWLKLS